MTPAEQGQERLERCSLQRVESLEMALASCQIDREKALAELEMCRRYFPKLQRSRADYKRRYEEAEQKLAACQEELEQADNGYAPAVTRVDNLVAARDEAVKRKKALEAERDYWRGKAQPGNGTWRGSGAEAQRYVNAALDQSGKGARS